MITMSPENLLELLKQHYPDAAIQEETQQIYTILNIEKKEYPLFLRVFDEGHLLQILTFIPCKLEKRTVSDMARLLHLLNKELDVPGFCMDEAAEVVFYRIMLPTPKKKIDPELLFAFLKTVEHVCQMFTGPIEAIGFGQLTLEDILKKAQELEQSN